MPTLVDEEVVRLQFQNDGFDDGVRESLLSIEKLKKGLDFTNAAKGIDQMSNQAKRLDLNPLANGLITVQQRFSTMQALALNALLQIENQAIQTGERMVKSLSVDQISAGWDKYAEKTSSVQTIMAATSKDFQDTGVQMSFVNGQLEKLNWFTDETSYNFLDMVNNIGKFTSNRIALDQSVTSMQGISNWAAISGANANEASRAMYNLAQAIATGSVKLIDWKSIENANMATAEFKETVIDTALAMGTLTRAGDGTIKTLAGHEVSVTNFNEQLKDGWFTSEVLLSTLDKYGAFTDAMYEFTQGGEILVSDSLRYIKEFKEGTLDMAEAAEETGYSVGDLENWLTKLGSDEYELGRRALEAAQMAKTFQEAVDATKDAVSTGWMKTFELIFGDFEHAKVLWTDLANSLYDIFAEPGNERNELLEGALTSGYTKISKLVQNAGGDVANFKDAIRDVYKELNGSDIDEVVKKYGGLDEAFQNGAISVDVLKRAIESLDGTTNKLDGVAEGLKLGDVGDDVKKVQQALIDAGQELSKFGVDGIIGSETTAAIKAFQEASDIEVTGIIDQATLDALGKAKFDTEGLAEAAEEFYGQVNQIDGRVKLIEGFKNILGSLLDVFGSIKEGWQEVFPPMTSDRLYEIISGFHEFTLALVPSEETLKAIQNTAKGVFSIFHIGYTAVKTVASSFMDIVKALVPLDGGLFRDLGNQFGEWASGIDKYITTNNVFGKAIDGASGYIKKMRDEFITFVKTNPEVQRILNSLVTTYNNLKTAIGSIDFESGWNKFVSMAKDLKDTIAELAGKAGISADDILKKVASGFEKLSSINFKGMFENLPKTIEEWKQKFKEFIAGFKIGEGFTNTIESIKTAFAGMRDTAGSSIQEFGSILSDVGGTILDVLGNIDVTAILTMGVMGSLIYTIVQFGRMTRGIRGVADEVGNFIDTLRTGIGGRENDQLGDKAIKLSFAIGILTACFYAISQIPIEKMTSSAIAIGVLMGALTAMLVILGLLEKANLLGDSKSIGAGLLMIAGAIGVMVFALNSVKDMSIQQSSDGVMLLIGLVAILGGAAAAISKFAPTFSSGSITMLVIAGSIWVMCEALEKIGTMNLVDDEGKIWENLKVLTWAIALLSGMAVAASKVKFTSGLGMIALVGAIAIFLGVMEKIKNFNPPQGIQQLTALTVVIGTFVGIGAIFSALDGGSIAKAGLGMLAMVFAIDLLIGVMKKIRQLRPAEARRGVVVIGIIALVFAAVSKLAGKDGAGLSAGIGFVAMAFAITLLTSCMKKLGELSRDEAEQALIIIGVIGLVFAAIMKLSNGVGGGFGSYLGLAFVLGTLAASLMAIYFLAEDGNKLERAAMALRKILTGLALALAAANFNKMSLGGVLAIGVMLGGITAALAVLTDSKYDLDRMEQVATMLEKFMGVMGIVSAVMAAVGGSAGVKGGVAGAVNFDIMIGNIIALGAVFYDVDLLFKHFTDGTYDLQMWFDDIFPNLEAFAEHFGAVLGKFASGFGNGLGITSFSTIGTDLSTFATNVSGFMQYMQSDEVEKAKPGIEAITGVLEGLSGLSFQIASAYDSIGDVKSDYFGDKMVALGEGLASFCDAFKDVVINDNVKNAAGVMNDVLTAISEIPDSGGILQGIKGGKEIGNFGKDLEPLATGIKTFCEAVDGIKTGDVKDAVGALDVVAGLSEKLPETGGGWQGIIGEIDFEKFGDALDNLGNGIADYCNAVVGIDDSGVETSTGVIKKLAELSDDIPNAGGWIQNIFGEAGYEEFGASMTKLGEGFSEFNGQIEGINVIHLFGVVEAIGTLSDAMVRLTGVSDLNTNTNFFTSVVTSLSEDGLNAVINTWSSSAEQATEAGDLFGQNIGTGVAQGITTSAETEIPGAATAIATIFVMNIITAITGTDYSGAGSSIVSKVTAAVRAKSGVARNAGVNLAKKIVEGMKSQSGSSAGISLASSFISTVSAYYKSAYSSGQYFASGFINGIKSKLQDAKNAATQMGADSVTALQTAIKQGSPSKLTTESGGFFGAGFINAILNSVAPAREAAGLLGSSAASVLDGIVSDIERTPMDFTPTVRPMFDLTTVQNQRDKMRSYVSGTSMQATIVANAMSASNGGKFDQLIRNTATMCALLSNGSDVYLDERTIVGRINRRLGGYM